MITDRDILILVALVRYYVLNRQQIQRLVFPTIPTGELPAAGCKCWWTSTHQPAEHALLPSVGHAGAGVFSARKGCEFLAEHFEDPQYLLTPTAPPIPHHTFHWLAVSDTHIALDEAIQNQDRSSASTAGSTSGTS